MTRFALCNEMYGPWPIERICQDAAQAGYHGLELAPFTLAENPADLTEEQARRIGRTIASFGLEVVGLHWLLVKPDGLHLTCDDDQVRRRTAEFLCHLARLCAAMGGSVLVLGSPKQRNIPPGTPADLALARAADICRTVCRLAGPLGVRLAIEPLARQETNLLNTAEQARRFIEQVDHPACALHLDVKAMADESQPFEQIITASADCLAHFHANDPNRLGPGMGQVDFRPIAQALRKIHYAGFVSVEVFDFSPGAPAIARQSIAALRQAWA